MKPCSLRGSLRVVCCTSTGVVKHWAAAVLRPEGARQVSPVGYKEVQRERGCLENGGAVLENRSICGRSSPVKSKAYRAIGVNRVNVQRCLQHRQDQPLDVGLDIGKREIL